jgi:hypothetical protein
VIRSSESTPGCACADWALGDSCAVRLVLIARTSAPLWDCRARGRGNETRRANAAGPTGLDHVPRAPRLGAISASVSFGLGAEVLPAGSVAATHVTPLSRPKRRDAHIRHGLSLLSPPTCSDRCGKRRPAAARAARVACCGARFSAACRGADAWSASGRPLRRPRVAQTCLPADQGRRGRSAVSCASS